MSSPECRPIMTSWSVNPDISVTPGVVGARVSAKCSPPQRSANCRFCEGRRCYSRTRRRTSTGGRASSRTRSCHWTPNPSTEEDSGGEISARDYDSVVMSRINANSHAVLRTPALIAVMLAARRRRCCRVLELLQGVAAAQGSWSADPGRARDVPGAGIARDL